MEEFEASVRLEEVTDRSLAKLASILHHLGMPHLQGEATDSLYCLKKSWVAELFGFHGGLLITTKLGCGFGLIGRILITAKLGCKTGWIIVAFDYS